MKKKLVIFLGVFLLFLIFWTNPSIKKFGTIKIWDRNNTLLYESAEKVGKKIPVSYEQLPKDLVNATLSSEDISFWNNWGIDMKALVRALFQNVNEGQIVSGASTITQQLARITIISPYKNPPRNMIRKIREILIALRLNAKYSKKEILTKYLNEVYYGNLAYGIQSASHVYFNKDVSQLSLAESALLTGLIASPENRNPFTNFKEAKKYQSQILGLMVKNKYISKEKAKEVKQEQLNFIPKQTDIKAPHFVHYVLQELEKLDIQSHQGINVYTTLGYPTYSLSEDIAKLWVNRLQDEHDLSNAALILIKNDSGEILDMLGGINYFDSKNSGQVNMTTALRQPGSALKPVTYATAFMQGYTPATLIYDVKKVYKTKKGEGFTPNNYDGRFHGLVLAREALASSLNLPAVEMLNRVGIDNFLKTAKDLGITTFNQEDRYDLAITLGGGEVRLIDLTNVFASLGRGGEYRPFYSIEKISDDDGKTLYIHKTEDNKSVLGNNGKQVAYLISNILADPKARIPSFGEKNPLVLSHPAAVKTGTTTDWHDNWTVGYTPDYTVGVWVGNNDNHPMKDITGVVGAAPIWNQFFEEFLKGKTTVQFTRPDKIKELEICALSGKLLDNLCPEKTSEIFIEGTEPKEVSNIYKKVKIDKRNDLLARISCPQEYVEDKIYFDYPPEVYTWAVEDGQEVIPRQYSPLCNGVQNVLPQSYLEITYPKEKTVFESAPLMVNNQGVVFEVNASSDINKMTWYVDGSPINTVTDFPFKTTWDPKIGEHNVKSIGELGNGGKIESDLVHFTVIEYQGSN